MLPRCTPPYHLPRTTKICKAVLNKPSFQYSSQESVNHSAGTVTDWVLFLNTYFWLPHIVDQQVGLVLDALAKRNRFAMNQMCSAVDFFGLICHLATGGTGA